MSSLNFIFNNEGVTFFGYLYSATGVFGHSFRLNEKEVFSISGFVAPNLTFILHSPNEKLLHKDYDGEITLAPGGRRMIEDESGKPNGYYEYVDIDEYNIVLKKLLFFVKVLENSWKVYRCGKLLASIDKIPLVERIRFQENGYDMEKCFVVKISSKIDESLYPYIMSIPMLGF